MLSKDDEFYNQRKLDTSLSFSNFFFQRFSISIQFIGCLKIGFFVLVCSSFLLSGFAGSTYEDGHLSERVIIIFKQMLLYETKFYYFTVLTYREVLSICHLAFMDP